MNPGISIFNLHLHTFNKFFYLRFTALFVLMMGGQFFLQPQLSAGGLTPGKLHLVPHPRDISTGQADFIINRKITIVLDRDHSAADRFTADELIRALREEWNIAAEIGSRASSPSVVLTRRQGQALHPQEYSLTTARNEVRISAASEDGLFYGTQTLMQLICKDGRNHKVPGVAITDWPDIEIRAVHYDIKHSQDKMSYVKDFIRDLARYKVNMLIWEWEDKFAYPSHPEIGAPGAFTMKEVQDLTAYARQYHIEIVPLVQGLGHVSYILKWPQHAHLREIAASNWQFCPLKEGAYDLLLAMLTDAIEATPGSEYIHIGSDETYELAACEHCRAKAEEIGRNGLYYLFINRLAEHLAPMGRKVMVWDGYLRHLEGRSPARGMDQAKGLVFIDGVINAPEYVNSRKAKEAGIEVFIYDPNPGVVPLMVPYDYEQGYTTEEIKIGSLEKSYNCLSPAAKSGVFKGMISTSWDDAGLHNQMWMKHFINATAWSWNGSNPSLEEFRDSYFVTYYGRSATNMRELFRLLNEAAYYYFWTMERRVWHYGEIGQTRLPGLPRGDALEYDPFWNAEYKERVQEALEITGKMDRALEIIGENKKAGARHPYDFELFRTIVELVKHTGMVYLDLSELENVITRAHRMRYVDHNTSLENLVKAQHIIETILRRREVMFNDLVATWEESRLPKGYQTDDQPFFWMQDRARHFAFRRPDMSFLIYDEQMLDMEGYLEKLKAYTEYFREINFIK
jgi:hexosaminidase